MKKISVFILLLLLIIILLWYVICQGLGEKRPPIILKTSNGIESTEFQLHDSILFDAIGLEPRTGYIIRIIRNDEKTIIEAMLSTDATGRIPETLLWYNIGVLPCSKSSRLTKAITYLVDYEINDPDYSGRSYLLQIVRNEEIIREMTFNVAAELSKPLLYASDSRGCPKSGFLIGEEDVWVVGKNFPTGSLVRLWAVPASSERVEGSNLEDMTKQYYGQLPPIFELQGDESGFRRLLWPKGTEILGSYDIVAEVISYPFGSYHSSTTADVHNFVANLTYSGFVIQRRPGAAEPLEMDIAGTVESPFAFRDTFLPSEDVYVGVDPCIQPSLVGQSAKVYIVADKPMAQWLDGTPLQDVTNFVETITVGGICGNCWKTLAWSHPLVVGKYDVVLDFNSNGIYDEGTDLIDSLDPTGFTVAEIRVDTICFNTGGTGTVTIYDNQSGVNVSAPEYVTSGHVLKPAAWVQGETYSVQVSFKAIPTVSNAQIWAESGLGGLESGTSPITVTFYNGSGQESFNVNSVPNSVGKHIFSWNWKYKNVNGTATSDFDMGNTGLHTVYTVLATPVAAGTMTVPWLMILDYACMWASGATTKEEVCTFILDNGYKSHYSWNMDCHRLASDFVRLVSTQGISGSLHRWASLGGCGDVDDMNYQKTIAFDPVGTTWGFQQIQWSWHQWAEAEGRQRDPSAGASLTGSWGVYEDYLFAEYKRVKEISPCVLEWVANQTGQTSGCEASGHRSYNPNPTLYSWRGPDR